MKYIGATVDLWIATEAFCTLLDDVWRFLDLNPSPIPGNLEQLNPQCTLQDGYIGRSNLYLYIYPSQPLARLITSTLPVFPAVPPRFHGFRRQAHEVCHLREAQALLLSECLPGLHAEGGGAALPRCRSGTDWASGMEWDGAWSKLELEFVS